MDNSHLFITPGNAPQAMRWTQSMKFIVHRIPNDFRIAGAAGGNRVEPGRLTQNRLQGSSRVFSQSS
jgi:hypothetical protein